jgi:Na+/proline symporter
MSYVFFGGMRGTAWVNTFQTVLFLLFGSVAVAVIGWGMGGFRASAEALLASPSSFLLTRERISPYYFLSYTFIPLSAIAFPHVTIFCLTARRMSQFRKTVIFYPVCILAIWGLYFGLIRYPVGAGRVRAGEPPQRPGAAGQQMKRAQRDVLRAQATPTTCRCCSWSATRRCGWPASWGRGSWPR